MPLLETIEIKLKLSNVTSFFTRYSVSFFAKKRCIFVLGIYHGEKPLLKEPLRDN